LLDVNAQTAVLTADGFFNHEVKKIHIMSLQKTHKMARRGKAV